MRLGIAVVVAAAAAETAAVVHQSWTIAVGSSVARRSHFGGSSSSIRCWRSSQCSGRVVAVALKSLEDHSFVLTSSRSCPVVDQCSGPP